MYDRHRQPRYMPMLQSLFNHPIKLFIKWILHDIFPLLPILPSTYFLLFPRNPIAFILKDRVLMV